MSVEASNGGDDGASNGEVSRGRASGCDDGASHCDTAREGDDNNTGDVAEFTLTDTRSAFGIELERFGESRLTEP